MSRGFSTLEDDDSKLPAADDNEDRIPIPDATQGPATATDGYDGCQDDDSSVAMSSEPPPPPLTEHD